MKNIDEMAQRSFVTGISLITSYGPNGQNVMAAEWTIQISYKPLLLAVFIHDGSRTLDNIKKTKYFGVNVASESQSDLVSVAGGYSRSEVDKLKIQNLFHLIDSNMNPPIIKDCVINAKCKLFATKKIGDHNMIVGKVVSIRHDKAKTPLLYHRNRYFRMGRAIKPLRNEITVPKKLFDIFVKDNQSKFILKLVGVIVKSKGKFFVLCAAGKDSVYTIPHVCPMKGKDYKNELENYLQRKSLNIVLKNDPMVKRFLIKNRNRIQRINFVLFKGTLLDVPEIDGWKFVKSDIFLKSLFR